MKIQVLDPHVVDQIAAGEVVERPSHLLKELLENSLDAGATEIQVEWDQGGRYILVQDNGSGISPEDLPLTVARHATSKIKSSEDLWSLQSYGFRGEALASIASVSDLRILSREKGQATGYELHCAFGQSKELMEVGSAEGTTVIMKDLFQNTPARLKFLKSESAESTQIKNVIKAMAMSYPHVSFRAKSKGEMLFFWPPVVVDSESLKAQGIDPQLESKRLRSQQVLNMEPLYSGVAEWMGLQAQVVITSPQQTVKSSRQLWSFVQDRWVQDRSLQKAILEGYRSLLMHGEYPIAAIWLTAPNEQVDVNIHPTKSQVKFQQPAEAFRAVRNAVRQVLEQGPWLEELRKKTQRTYADVSPLPIESPSYSFNTPEFQRTQYSKKEDTSQGVKEKVLQYSSDYLTRPQDSYFTPAQWSSSSQNLQANKSVAEPSVLIDTSPTQDLFWSQLDIIGQAHLTYVVAQNEEALIYVDQHAAHERVMYERLMKAWRDKKIEVQNYLLPLTVSLEESEVEALVTLQEELEGLGLTIEAMGPNVVAVSAAPLVVKDKSLAEALKLTAQEYLENPGSFHFEEVVRDIAATMACHSVIRAGQALSREQMQKLLVQMDEFPKSSFCPHGRPVYIEYSFNQLEKDFGRLV